MKIPFINPVIQYLGVGLFIGMMAAGYYYAALGVALSGWSATFFSTGLAIAWGDQLSLERHIQIVDSFAMLFFLALLVFAFLPNCKTEAI
jgi:hypothetical protein